MSPGRCAPSPTLVRDAARRTRLAGAGFMGTSLAVPLHRRKSMGTWGQRDPAFRSGLTARGHENAWCVSTCRVVVAELERSRRSPNEAKIEFNSDLREPGLAQSGKPRRAKRRRAAFLGGKTERASLASSASVAQAMGDGVVHRPEQRRPRSGKLGALHGASGRSDLGRGGIALTRKRALRGEPTWRRDVRGGP